MENKAWYVNELSSIPAIDFVLIHVVLVKPSHHPITGFALVPQKDETQLLSLHKDSHFISTSIPETLQISWSPVGKLCVVGRSIGVYGSTSPQLPMDDQVDVLNALNNDISVFMQTRAQNGYGLSISQNYEIIKTEFECGGETNPELRSLCEVWKWMTLMEKCKDNLKLFGKSYYWGGITEIMTDMLSTFLLPALSADNQS